MGHLEIYKAADLDCKVCTDSYLVVKRTVGGFLSSCVLFLISNSNIHSWVDVHPYKFLSFNHIYIHLKKNRNKLDFDFKLTKSLQKK